MNEKQAIEKAAKLNATRYRNSRIKVKPFKYGTIWILVGV